MNPSSHPLLECIANGKFAEASVEAQKLPDLAKNSQENSEVLALIKTAREHALVQRAHLLKSLDLLQTSQLYKMEGEQLDPTWSLEG